MQKKPFNLKRRLSLFIVFAVLVSLILTIGGTAYTDTTNTTPYVNLEAYTQAVPFSTAFAENRAALLAAIAGPGVTTIYITDDFLVDGDAVNIPPGRDITITSATGGPFAIYQTTADQRHFEVS